MISKMAPMFAPQVRPCVEQAEKEGSLGGQRAVRMPRSPQSDRRRRPPSPAPVREHRSDVLQVIIPPPPSAIMWFVCKIEPEYPTRASDPHNAHTCHPLCRDGEGRRQGRSRLGTPALRAHGRHTGLTHVRLSAGLGNNSSSVESCRSAPRRRARRAFRG